MRTYARTHSFYEDCPVLLFQVVLLLFYLSLLSTAVFLGLLEFSELNFFLLSASFCIVRIYVRTVLYTVKKLPQRETQEERRDKI